MYKECTNLLPAMQPVSQTSYNRVKLVDTICLVSLGRRCEFIIEFDTGQNFLNKALLEFLCLIVLPYLTETSISDIQCNNESDLEAL
jgi:hypothetical protein